MPLRALIVCLIALMTLPALAGPERYRLDTDRSVVGFTYSFEGAEQSGRMPVASADMRIDLDNVAKSRVDVTLDASRARAGFLLATQAMKGPEVLDTARFPQITFRSTRVTGDLSGATVTGELTVRGITRPVMLRAGLYRQRGTEAGNTDRLAIQLTGSISRSAFGADGFAGFVDDRIGLTIIARIEK